MESIVCQCIKVFTCTKNSTKKQIQKGLHNKCVRSIIDCVIIQIHLTENHRRPGRETQVVGDFSFCRVGLEGEV